MQNLEFRQKSVHSDKSPPEQRFFFSSWSFFLSFYFCHKKFSCKATDNNEHFMICTRSFDEETKYFPIIWRQTESGVVLDFGSIELFFLSVVFDTEKLKWYRDLINIIFLMVFVMLNDPIEHNKLIMVLQTSAFLRNNEYSRVTSINLILILSLIASYDVHFFLLSSFRFIFA